MTTTIRNPEQMRQAVGGYVAAVHRAYVTATAQLEPAVARALPLRAAGEFTVLAVAAGDLHLIATSQALPPARGPEVEAGDEVGGLRWRLRFYDAVVLPELGSLASGPGAEASEAVRRVLGLESWIYHLMAAPRPGLSVHNAFHAGNALAEGHAREVLGAILERP
jgi:hypothetical protein